MAPGVLGIHAPAFSFLLSVVNAPQDRMFLEENMSFLEQLANAPTLGPQLPSGAGTPSPVLALGLLGAYPIGDSPLEEEEATILEVQRVP